MDDQAGSGRSAHIIPRHDSVVEGRCDTGVSLLADQVVAGCDGHQRHGMGPPVFYGTPTFSLKLNLTTSLRSLRRAVFWKMVYLGGLPIALEVEWNPEKRRRSSIPGKQILIGTSIKIKQTPFSCKTRRDAIIFAMSATPWVCSLCLRRQARSTVCLRSVKRAQSTGEERRAVATFYKLIFERQQLRAVASLRLCCPERAHLPPSIRRSPKSSPAISMLALRND